MLHDDVRRLGEWPDNGWDLAIESDITRRSAGWSSFTTCPSSKINLCQLSFRHRGDEYIGVDSDFM